ncbi:hypothetical protein LPJ71_010967, partial [Coemansia sp. S17]
RFMSQTNDSDNKMVLGNTPFTFSMPPRQTEPEPMVVDSEAAVTRPAVRSSDNNPISPNAVRKIYSRRRNQQQIARRRNMPIGFGEASSSWTTDEEQDNNNNININEEDSDRLSVHSNASSRAPASQRRLQRQRQRQQSRPHRRSSAVTRGVDRMLALMGSRVDEPTVVERLQMYRDLPYVISGYLQLVFNVFMV